jgi:glycosyltransferase involved in cell wall biosynthesis
MKVAFVNQPIDTILPPYQSSVGACTYGAASSLGRLCDVVVYGNKDRNPDVKSDMIPQNVQFRFFPSTLSDRLLYELRSKCSRLGQMTSPASTSDWLFPAFGRQVARDLQQQRCDVIHVQHCSQFVPVIRALNPAAKIVLHLHAEWFSQNDHEALARRLRDVDLLTTVSDYVTEKTRREFPMIADRCQTTYNGIDSKEFGREKDYSAVGGKVRRIMYAGAVSPHKGLHVLLSAFKIVARKYPDTRLDIIGFHGTYPPGENFDAKDVELLKTLAPLYAKNYGSRLMARLSLAPPDAGTYVSYLKARLSADIADKVAFLGMIPRSKLIERYFNADIFVFPAIWNEGFGIPPVEAMAAGVPVVASRSGAVVETVKHNETGFLVEKNDPYQLARALSTLLESDNLRETMGRAARRRAFERFTWDGVAEAMYKRYQALCAEGSVSALRAGSPVETSHSLRPVLSPCLLRQGSKI